MRLQELTQDVYIEGDMAICIEKHDDDIGYHGDDQVYITLSDCDENVNLSLWERIKGYIVGNPQVSYMNVIIDNGVHFEYTIYERLR